MKNIFAICLAVLLFASCDDNFLNLYPQNNTTEAIFYKTEDHFTQAINASYTSLRGVYNEGYYMGEMRSDNTHYTYNFTDRALGTKYKEDVANFTIDDSQNSLISNMWQNCYVGISRTNTVLEHIYNAELSDNFKNRIIGEAKFIRAFLYFQLVQCYGRVPLQLEPVKNEGNAFPDQASAEEVYTAIIDDVKDAIGKLPSVEFSKESNQATGAATKGAAKMLYAYILMTKPSRDYSTAATELKDVLENMGYGLIDNYADVFDTSMKNSKEHIFSIQYQMGDQKQQSSWLYNFIPRSKEAQAITGVALSNVMGAGWNVPTQAMIDSYEQGDLRLNPSVAVAVGDPDDAAMIIKGVLNVKDPEIAGYKVAIPFINKYRHPHTKVNNTDDNWPVYRYADALLLMAECLVEQGLTANAAPYVNQVRKRAGLDNAPTITADVVANERRHELAFENHRWYDLVRTGKAIEVMTAYGKYIKSVDRNIVSRAYNIKPEYLLYPIPYREMETNKKLTQNPGY